MRKVSKNRTDDDVISSTNGSTTVANEDQKEVEKSTEDNEKDSEISANDPNESTNDSSHVAKDDKVALKKGKGKKKKVEKITKQADSEEEYEVEKIVDSKKIKGKLHYLIRWKGYSADSDTWEPENTLSCPDLIMKYIEEKENSKNKGDNTSLMKKGNKRKSKSMTKLTSKKAKNTEWDEKTADETAEYEVDRILEVHHKKSGKREFLIHWKGWSSKFDSWEPESNLNCPELIKKFMDKVDAARATESRSLRVAPETTNRFTLQAPSSGRRLSKRQSQRQRVRYDDAE